MLALGRMTMLSERMFARAERMRKRGRRAYAMFLRRDAKKVAQLEQQFDFVSALLEKANTGYEQLEADNAALKRKAQDVVDGATGGGFDKFSGFDDYVISYQLIDELADALLTAEESE